MRPRKAKPGEPMCCENCRHYHQHYVKWGDPAKNSYMKCDSGHCTSGHRTKITRWYFVCGEFEEKKQGNRTS